MTASVLHLVTSVLLLINLVLTGKTLRDTKFHAQTETLQVFAQLRLLFPKLEELASHTKDQLSTLNSLFTTTEPGSHKRLVLSIKERIDTLTHETHQLRDLIIDKVANQTNSLEAQLTEINSQLSTLNSELVTHNSKLVTLSSPLAALAEAQTQNIIKEGESNRNLRRRLQQKEETLVAARKAIKDQESRISKLNSQLLAHRDATRQALEELLEEISLIHGWVEDKGMPSQSLDKYLSLQFKGTLPSTLAQRAINAEQFQATLRGIPVDVPANPKHAKTS